MSGIESMYKLRNYMSYKSNIKSHHNQTLSCTYHSPVSLALRRVCQ